MDVEFLVLDVFEELRPKLKMFKNFEAAVQALEKIRMDNVRKSETILFLWFC